MFMTLCVVEFGSALLSLIWKYRHRMNKQATDDRTDIALLSILRSENSATLEGLFLKLDINLRIRCPSIYNGLAGFGILALFYQTVKALRPSKSPKQRLNA